MRRPEELRTADDVDALCAELYGEPLDAARGTLHVMAVAREGDGHRVIKIGEHAPKSDLDFFALNLARARVEAIVVTGSVLRAEPELVYELGAAPEALSAWRARRFEEPPWLLVMSRGALPAEHPVWESWARPIAFVPEDAAAEVRDALPDRVEVVGAEATDGRAAIGHLRRERGCASVSVEAGPSVAKPLYDSPLAVDELMLSVFEGDLDPRARGGEFLSEAQLAGRLARASRVEVGAWRFSRWRSRRGSAGGSR